MKRYLGILVLLFILSGKTDAQYVRTDSVTGSHKPPPPYNFWDHASLGGNFGLQFGTVTFVGISPLLNYHITSNIMLGAGPIYQYYKDNYYNYSSSIYGFRVAAVCYLPGGLSKIFLMGEYDVINVPYFNTLLLEDSRTTIAIPLVGGGYRQPVGNNSYFLVAALWSLSNSNYSPYMNPIITAGFDIGL